MKNFLPVLPEIQIRARVGRIFCFIDAGVSERRRITAEKRREHHDKSILVNYSLGCRRPVKFKINQETYLCVNMSLRQFVVDSVKNHNIPVGKGFFRTLRTFADVIVIVRKPEMDYICFRVIFSIYRDFFSKFLTHRLFRIAKLRV